MSAHGALSAERGLRDLLDRPLLARLATVDDDGYPVIVPVWYEYANDAFWVVARAHSAYVAHLRARARVGLSIVDDADPDRRLTIRGTAHVVGAAGPLEGPTLELARRLATRYEEAPGLRYIERSRSWPRVLVRIDPDSVTGWSSPDWHPRYRRTAHQEDR